MCSTPLYRLWRYNLTHLLRFFLEFLNGSFVDASALVDEVPGGGRLAGVDVANDHDVDVDLLLGHVGSAVREEGDERRGGREEEEGEGEKERERGRGREKKDHTIYL